MKNGWQTKPLGELCEVLDHKRKPVTKRDRVAGAYPYYGATGVQDYVADYLFDEPLVLVGEDGAKWESGENTAFAVEGKCWVNNHAHVLRPMRNLLIDNWLIHYFHLSDLSEFVSGLTVPKLNQGNLREIPIPLPPLAEQRRIVGILDEAFEGLATAKANAEQNLQNARALFESHLQAVFTQRGHGWREIQLADVCERLHQGLNTAGEKVKFYDEGYPIIQTRNIDDGVVELDNKIKFMCEADWQLYKDKFRPEVGDVFFTNIGTIGKTAIVTEDRDYLIHWNIFKLRPRLEKITSEFLRYTLESLTLCGYFEKLQKGGTVDFVTKKMISEALIYLPSLAEQKQIVATLDSLREETQRLESLYQRKLAALDELKKSLLHRAFSGQL